MQLGVDGVARDPGVARFNFETNPFPGGHRYRLQLSHSDTNQEVLGYAKFRSVTNPSESEARHWFFWLAHIVSRCCDPETAVGETFVLNNIESLELEDNGITLSGMCSPWIQLAGRV